VQEIPYDGWDNDCTDGDVLDQDGDGFPGISQEEYEALPSQPDWPNDARDDGKVDCRDDVNEHPNAKDIFPGSTLDTEYDGIDHNCLGDNDFDVDGDGYVARGYEDAFATYLAE